MTNDAKLEPPMTAEPYMPTADLTDDMLFKVETGETIAWAEINRRLSAAPAPQEGERSWESLSCDEQFDLATKIAANVGYILTPEPDHPDSPHSRPAAPAPVAGELAEAHDALNEAWIREGKLQDALFAAMDAEREALISELEAILAAEPIFVVNHPISRAIAALRRPAAPAPVAGENVGQMVERLRKALNRVEPVNVLDGQRNLVHVENGETGAPLFSVPRKHGAYADLLWEVTACLPAALAALTAGAEPRATEAGEGRVCDDCGFEGASEDANAELDYCTACGANSPTGGPDECTQCEAKYHMVPACPKCGGRFSLDLDDALHPASPDADKPEGEAVAIKPLDWRKPTEHDEGHEQCDLIAPGLGGVYAIQNDGAGVILWRVEDPFAFDNFPSVEAAKAHAEDHWRQTISRKITHPPKPDGRLSVAVEALRRIAAAVRVGGRAEAIVATHADDAASALRQIEGG